MATAIDNPPPQECPAALLDAYSEWLANERAALHRERFGAAWRETLGHVQATPANDFHFQWQGACVTNPEPPSRRAATVLAHVGVNWRETEAQPEAGDGEPMAPDEILLLTTMGKSRPRRAQGAADLSFVGALPPGSPKPRTFWSVAPTGDYARDCTTGERLAAEYLDYVRNNPDAPPLLQWIVEDMPRALSGVEIGFLSMIAA